MDEKRKSNSAEHHRRQYLQDLVHRPHPSPHSVALHHGRLLHSKPYINGRSVQRTHLCDTVGPAVTARRSSSLDMDRMLSGIRTALSILTFMDEGQAATLPSRTASLKIKRGLFQRSRWLRSHSANGLSCWATARHRVATLKLRRRLSIALLLDRSLLLIVTIAWQTRLRSQDALIFIGVRTRLALWKLGLAVCDMGLTGGTVSHDDRGCFMVCFVYRLGHACRCHYRLIELL